MKQWIKECVGYEIYPRSFFDSNHDGMGDIQGIIQKLDYLEKLGVNLLWIGPFYPSPLDDNGYDVSDFKNVDQQLGTLDDIKLLIKKAHQKGMRIIFDYVMNQTSDEHPWFIESSQSTDNVKRQYYIWAKGKNNHRPPNNWASFFGGPAWKYDAKTDEYFMKIFSDKMPDLNWSNPQVRSEMFDVAKFWLDLGADGFRMDAIAHLAKDMTLTDSRKKVVDGVAADWSKFSNRPMLYEYLRELNQTVLSKYDCVTIGEVGGGAKIKDALQYVNHQRSAIDMVFNFDACWCLKEDKTVDVLQLKRVLNYWITESIKHQIYCPQYWLNHDHPRVISQYGSMNYWQQSGKALALLLLSLYGLPFIYNGEEIGMTNALYEELSDYKDVSSQNYIALNQHRLTKTQLMNHLRLNARDHGHLPMQWSDKMYAGFSQCEPYLKVNPNYERINVAHQMADPHSIFNFYKAMIELRRHSIYRDILIEGDFTLVESNHEQIVGFKRTYQQKSLVVLVNLSEQVATYQTQDGVIVISNLDAHQPQQLAPYEAVIME